MVELTLRALAILACVLLLGLLAASFFSVLPKTSPADLFQASSPAPSPSRPAGAMESPTPGVAVPSVTPQPDGKFSPDDNEAVWASLTQASAEAACVSFYRNALASAGGSVASCACPSDETPTTKRYDCQAQTNYGPQSLSFACDKNAQTCTVRVPGAPEQTVTFAQLLQTARQQNG